MPFTYTCPDHPDAVIDPNEVGIAEHIDAEHTIERVSAHGRIVRRFTSQTVAQGHAPLRVFGCRKCGRSVESRDPNRPPYCDTDLPA